MALFPSLILLWSMVYTMEEDIVHSSGMEKVVFLSTIDEPRNKSKISKIWNITVSGGPLYKKSTNRGIEYYQDKEILSKEGNSFTANLESEAVKEDLKESLKDSSDINQYFHDDIDGFIDFLKSKPVVDNLLTPQAIRETFGAGKDDRLERIREEKVTRYFVLIATSSLKLWIDKRSNTFFDDYPNSSMIEGMAKGMITALFQDVDNNSQYDVTYLAGKIEDLYDKDPGSVEYLLDSYDEIITEQIQNSLPD